MSRADIFKRKEREVTADSIVKDSVNAADALNNIYGKGSSGFYACRFLRTEWLKKTA